MDDDEQLPEAAPPPVRAAAAIVGLEAVALVVLAAIVVVKTITGTPSSVGGALLATAGALAGAALLAFGARGLVRLRAASRAPVLVMQLLALPVSYSLGFQAHRIGYGGPIFVAALAVLYLLFTPPARAALDREPPA